MPIEEISAIAFVGLIAGVLGGLAGVGGSIIMLPALHVLFSAAFFGEPADPQVHHLYMAAAMTVNVVVSIPAAVRHHREGAVRTGLLKQLIPAGCIAVVAGVLVSNLFDGESLRVLLAVFLMAYCFWNLRLIARPRRRKFGGQGRVEITTKPRLVTCSAATGVVGGVLGLGGGFMMVPLLQILCNLRLKNAIATSSAVLCFTALVGAAFKIGTLPEHHESIREAARLAAIMTPTAVVGALTGATWLHKIPVTTVRLVMMLLILVAATKLIA